MTNKPPITVFDDRELNTVLHALRVLRELHDPPQSPGCVAAAQFPELADTTSCDHFEEVSELSGAEIEALCDRLQLQPEPGAPPQEHVWIVTCGSKSSVIEKPAGVAVHILDWNEILTTPIKELGGKFPPEEWAWIIQHARLQPSCGHVPTLPDAEETTCWICGATVRLDPATRLWREVQPPATIDVERAVDDDDTPSKGEKTE